MSGETLRDVTVLVADSEEMAAEIARNAARVGFEPALALDPTEAGTPQTDGAPRVGSVVRVRSQGRAVVADFVGVVPAVARALRGGGVRLRSSVAMRFKGLGAALKSVAILGSGLSLASLGDFRRLLFAEGGEAVRTFTHGFGDGPPLRYALDPALGWFTLAADAGPGATEALVANLLSAFKTRDRTALDAALRRVADLDHTLAGAVRQATVALDSSRWDMLRRVLTLITQHLLGPQSSTTRGGATMSTFASTTLADLVTKLNNAIVDYDFKAAAAVADEIEAEVKTGLFHDYATQLRGASPTKAEAVGWRLLRDAEALVNRRAAPMSEEAASIELSRRTKEYVRAHPERTFSEAWRVVREDPANEALVEAYTADTRAEVPVIRDDEVQEIVRRFISEHGVQADGTTTIRALRAVGRHDLIARLTGMPNAVLFTETRTSPDVQMRDLVYAEIADFKARTGREITFAEALARVRADKKNAAVVRAYAQS